MLLNYLNLWLYKQIPCHSFRIPTLKVIKSENFNIFCFTIFVYNSYTKGCKIHPRITTFYGIIFSPVFCRNFLPKPSEFCCTKKGRFLHHDGICRYLYHHTLFRQNFPPPGSHSAHDPDMAVQLSMCSNSSTVNAYDCSSANSYMSCLKSKSSLRGLKCFPQAGQGVLVSVHITSSGSA